MRNYLQPLKPFFILPFALLLLCFGCANDDDSNRSDFENGDKLGIDNIKEFFPVEAYQANEKILFKNALGHERLFTITSIEGVRGNTAMTIEGELIYTYDFLDFNLLQENSPNYEMNLNMRASVHGEDNIIAETISLSVAPFESLPFLIMGDSPLFAVFSYPSNLPTENTIDVLDKTFEDVFTLERPANEGFTKVYFNAEIGVVGFVDEFDDIYVFDSFQ